MARREEFSKAQAQRLHAKKRATERYGLTLNRERLDAIVADIQGGRAFLVRRQSMRIAHYDVTVADQRCRVVYDRNRKTIVTFLPKEAMSETPAE